MILQFLIRSPVRICPSCTTRRMVDPPRIAAARCPPLWEAAGQSGNDLLIQPLPEFDQRIA